MRGGTLFSGIGAPELAMRWVDWRWCAEIDPFASAVHAARFPGVPNLGDVTEIDWHAVEPVDIVVGGPPCQGFSVAGKRGGLADPRGNLSLAYVAALDAIDPAWSLTENVPGWLSMSDNSFGHFLAAMVGAGAALVPDNGQCWTDAGVVAGPRRTAAWRTLDAQFCGLAQRRRRVFVLAGRGAGDWACAEALFPLRSGGGRDPAPRRAAGQRVARPVASCPDGGSGYRNDADTADNLIAYGGGLGTDFDCDGELIALDMGGNKGMNGGGLSFDMTPTLAQDHPPAVAFQTSQSGVRLGPQHPTLDSHNGSRRHHGALQGMAVRRLTPQECERLQGFPPGFTAIAFRGKPAADEPRYRAIGNSIAVPCVRWIGARIAAGAERAA